VRKEEVVRGAGDFGTPECTKRKPPLHITSEDLATAPKFKGRDDEKLGEELVGRGKPHRRIYLRKEEGARQKSRCAPQVCWERTHELPSGGEEGRQLEKGVGLALSLSLAKIHVQPYEERV